MATVITQPITFVATATLLHIVGQTGFVDVDFNTIGLSPSAMDVGLMITLTLEQMGSV